MNGSKSMRFRPRLMPSKLHTHRDLAGFSKDSHASALHQLHPLVGEQLVLAGCKHIEVLPAPPACGWLRSRADEGAPCWVFNMTPKPLHF
jgi:hypothetical protein